MTATERDPEFENLLEFLRDERGFDFTGYKRPSLMRRIAKRMQDAKFDGGFEDYRGYLTRNPEEFGQLFDTILINVTSFFRDPQAWEYVGSEIVPRIVEARSGDPIRVWSTGCSTGEEAYTLAIVFAEAVGEDDFKQRVKIYATDVDEHALGSGRAAMYTAAQIEPVPQPLREKYFEQQNGGWCFRPDLRRSVIFGRHDLVQDPPISRIDLLVSRNTLMYFDVESQQRILGNFHFALRDDGFLFLGKSEVLVARSPLFAAVDLRRRVFAKVPIAAARDRAVPRVRPNDDDQPAAEATERAGDVQLAGFEASPVAQLLVDRAGRVAAANMSARILFGLGHRDVGSLLQDLEISYRPVELRSRIEQAYAEGHAVTLRDVEWHSGAEVRYLDVVLHPLTSQAGETIGVAIAFSDVTRYRRLGEALQESKREVEIAYEELQSTVEELETTNEELQSTNEELETTNEELQSTNEELETMNEELQSTNEELETINDELQQRTDELNDVNSFLEAVLGSLAAAVIVVDRELRVTAWNDAARELWGLHSSEVQGEHLLNLDIGLPVDKLRNPIRAVLAGEDGNEPLLLDAVNRRGKPIRIGLRFAALANGGADVRGAIVMMETSDA
jgi:two-component system, chemotaxis family, CheB/CheR fusion protein